jgi:hypothetical protein
MDITKQLDEGTYLQQGGEIRSWSYFSRYAMVANTTEAKLFSAKLGDAGFTRIDQTNMPLGGQIPTSQRLDVKGIAIRYQPGAAKSTANANALLNWLATTVLQFNITDKIPMFQMRLASLMGMVIPLIQTDGAVNILVNTVQTVAKPIYMLERKIVLASQTPFSVSILPGVAAGATQVSDADFLDVGLVGDLWSKV